MNGLSRRLHELEENELEFPEDDEIFLHVGDSDEVELHNRAQALRETMRADAEEIINNTDLTIEQQNEMSKQLLSRLSEREKAIVEQSSNFIEYRLKRLLYKHFAAGYPKGEDTRVMLRIMWFFREMDKLNSVNHLEDYEFEHNRNEEDPSFDDFAWWDTLEAKKLKLFPEGVFTEKSYEAVEEEYDTHIARKIREYYEAHPGEREALINGLNRKIEELKKSE
jgi:hypothetical protein